MPKKRARQNEAESSIFRVPNFLKLYATNVKGGASNQDFRFQVMNEKLKDEDGWHFVSDALVILTPVAARNLKTLLDEYIIAFEKEHGPIKTKFRTEKEY